MSRFMKYLDSKISSKPSRKRIINEKADEYMGDPREDVAEALGLYFTDDGMMDSIDGIFEFDIDTLREAGVNDRYLNENEEAISEIFHEVVGEIITPAIAEAIKNVRDKAIDKIKSELPES